MDLGRALQAEITVRDPCGTIGKWWDIWSRGSLVLGWEITSFIF